jgi:DNA-binding NtrC family response regulator
MSRGTIVLDESGELSLESQVKRLRVLHDGAFERVGGSRTVPVDVRVMAATNRQLDLAIEAGAFHEDTPPWVWVLQRETPRTAGRVDDAGLRTETRDRIANTVSASSSSCLERVSRALS